MPSERGLSAASLGRFLDGEGPRATLGGRSMLADRCLGRVHVRVDNVTWARARRAEQEQALSLVEATSW